MKQSTITLAIAAMVLISFKSIIVHAVILVLNFSCYPTIHQDKCAKEIVWNYLVQNNACDSLLAIHGVPADISQYSTIFANIQEEKQTNKYALARAQLKDLFQNEGKRD